MNSHLNPRILYRAVRLSKDPSQLPLSHEEWTVAIAILEKVNSKLHGYINPTKDT